MSKVAQGVLYKRNGNIGYADQESTIALSL